ncbi:MAG: phage major tail tube protein [Asticcacaulis sp.]
MALPPILKNWNLHVDGGSYLGQIASVTLPKVARLTEDYRGGGMGGAAELDLGMDKIVFELKPGGLLPKLIGKFGHPRLDGVLLRFTGAYQDDATGGWLAGEFVARGRFKELDFGSAEAGSKNEQNITYTATYVRMTAGGVEYLEWSLMPPKFVVNGVDREAELRAILGV